MRIRAYIEPVTGHAIAEPTDRWELYKLLGDPARLRLLALAAEEELSIGELAELLGDPQPTVSRRLKGLRSAALLDVRRQGRRVLVKFADEYAGDAVVADAVASGRRLCADDGSLARVTEVVAARDADARAFFSQPRPAPDLGRIPDEMPAYLAALAPLMARRGVAVDVGTGDGGLLDMLAPVFDRVLAVDREQAQLSQARARIGRRGYDNVTLLCAGYGDEALRDTVQAMGGADAVFLSRVLHHAPKPTDALRAVTDLLVPGGALIVIDYVSHEDERLRDEQADLWLGFTLAELTTFATGAGLEVASRARIPHLRCGDGPDGHLDWQVFVARRPNHEN